MTQEALKMALEALEYWDVHGKLHQPTEEAITAIKEALAQPEQEQTNIERHEANVQKFLGAPQPEQEPVAMRWLAEMIMSDCGCSTNNERLLERVMDRIDQYERANTPPQRTWVGLTRTQMQDVYFAVLEEHRGGHQMEGQLAFGEALQAKLKEENT